MCLMLDRLISIFLITVRLKLRQLPPDTRVEIGNFLILPTPIKILVRNVSSAMLKSPPNEWFAS